MQGLALLTQLGMAILNGFGITSMFQAYIGGALFLSLVGIGIAIIVKNK